MSFASDMLSLEASEYWLIFSVRLLIPMLQPSVMILAIWEASSLIISFISVLIQENAVAIFSGSFSSFPNSASSLEVSFSSFLCFSSYSFSTFASFSSITYSRTWFMLLIPILHPELHSFNNSTVCFSITWSLAPFFFLFCGISGEICIYRLNLFQRLVLFMQRQKFSFTGRIDIVIFFKFCLHVLHHCRSLSYSSHTLWLVLQIAIAPAFRLSITIFLSHTSPAEMTGFLCSSTVHSTTFVQPGTTFIKSALLISICFPMLL